MRGDQRGGAMSGVGSTAAIFWCGNVGAMAGILLGMLFRVTLVCVRGLFFNPRLAVGFGAVIIGVHWRCVALVVSSTPFVPLGSVVSSTHFVPLGSREVERWL